MDSPWCRLAIPASGALKATRCAQPSPPSRLPPTALPPLHDPSASQVVDPFFQEPKAEPSEHVNSNGGEAVLSVGKGVPGKANRAMGS